MEWWEHHVQQMPPVSVRVTLTRRPDRSPAASRTGCGSLRISGATATQGDHDDQSRHRRGATTVTRGPRHGARRTDRRPGRPVHAVRPHLRHRRRPRLQRAGLLLLRPCRRARPGGRGRRHARARASSSPATCAPQWESGLAVMEPARGRTPLHRTAATRGAVPACRWTCRPDGSPSSPDAVTDATGEEQPDCSGRGTPCRGPTRTSTVACTRSTCCASCAADSTSAPRTRPAWIRTRRCVLQTGEGERRAVRLAAPHPDPEECRATWEVAEHATNDGVVAALAVLSTGRTARAARPRPPRRTGLSQRPRGPRTRDGAGAPSIPAMTDQEPDPSGPTAPTTVLVEVTDTISIGYTTGIQRVVREIIPGCAARAGAGLRDRADPEAVGARRLPHA